MPEFLAAMDGFNQRRRQAFEIATLTAWQTANLMRSDPKRRLPTLKKLFAQFAEKDDKPQTLTQMKKVLTMLSHKYGIPLRKVSKADAHG